MGRNLAIDSSTVQLLPQWNSVIATSGFYRLAPECSAHAGLIVLVEIFLIYPSTMRRYKRILEL